MSTNLPKELQTKKLNSLPKELKAIADELLAEKFPEEVQEEVAVEDDRDFFQQEFDSAFRQGSLADEPIMDSFRELRERDRRDDNGPKARLDMDIQTMRRRVTYDFRPSDVRERFNDRMMDILYELESENVPQSGRKFYVCRDGLRDLERSCPGVWFDNEAYGRRLDGEEVAVGHIYGIPIYPSLEGFRLVAII